MGQSSINKHFPNHFLIWTGLGYIEIFSSTYFIHSQAPQECCCASAVLRGLVQIIVLGLQWRKSCCLFWSCCLYLYLFAIPARTPDISRHPMVTDDSSLCPSLEFSFSALIKKPVSDWIKIVSLKWRCRTINEQQSGAKHGLTMRL